ncbi:MAG TPA: FAD-dependent oxidoreductase [Candidatus Methylomirabilis sp.]|jgi:hypothetical protein
MGLGFDVVVVGGGPAGITAAVAAGRLGMRTALVEAGRALGGLATLGLCLAPYHDAGGDPVAGGLAEEIVQRLQGAGGTVGHIRWPGGPFGSVTPVDPAGLQSVLSDLVREAGVQVLLQHTATDVVWHAGRVAGVVAHGVGGPLEVRGPAVVDATRDGTLAALAGAVVVAGRGADLRAAPPTLVLPLADVRLAAALRSPFGVEGMTLWAPLPGGRRPAPVYAVGTLDPWRQHLARDGLTLNGVGYVHCHSGRRGRVVLTVAGLAGDDPSDPWDRSAGELENARRADGLLRLLRRHVRGFGAAGRTNPPVTVWESRRIVGEYMLTEADVLEGRRFVDCVARGAHPLPGAAGPEGGGPFVAPRRGGAYDIPYRCLLPRGVPGLLMAGRGLSADPRALAALRGLPAGFVVGEAAGTAAALAALTGQDPRHVDIRFLQRTLVKNGALLGRAFADL